MKYFIKGILLGLSLPLANRLCVFLGDASNALLVLISVLIFGIITFAFLLSDNVANLLLCGFSGLFSMFVFEIFVMFRICGFGNEFEWFISYFAGMYGSIIATVIAIILTVKKVKIFDYIIKEGVFMTKELKIKLMLYTLISAIGVSYLVLPENAGIPAIEYLLENTEDDAIKNKVKKFIEKQADSPIPDRWQRFNISTENTQNILEKLKN